MCQIEILRDFNLFSVDFRRQNCPSVRCAWAANAIGGYTDLLDGNSVSINDLLVSVAFDIQLRILMQTLAY